MRVTKVVPYGLGEGDGIYTQRSDKARETRCVPLRVVAPSLVVMIVKTSAVEQRQSVSIIGKVCRRPVKIALYGFPNGPLPDPGVGYR
jgi:hypothetical protein